MVHYNFLQIIVNSFCTLFGKNSVPSYFKACSNKWENNKCLYMYSHQLLPAKYCNTKDKKRFHFLIYFVYKILILPLPIYMRVVLALFLPTVSQWKWEILTIPFDTDGENLVLDIQPRIKGSTWIGYQYGTHLLFLSPM